MSAAAGARRPAGLLTSIHDVTPALDASVRVLWDLCRANGLTPALLVVPDWHGAWPIERHALFMDWVRARVRDGAEIILHGERHDEVGSPRAIGDTLRAIGRTAREGEFLTLEYDAARERIARGLLRLRDQHLEPTGFVPPAWLAREATHDVVRASGLAFSEDAGSIRLHKNGERLEAPALRWSGRGAVRAWGSRIVADHRWRTRADTPLLRLALHPQDLAHPVTAASVMRDVSRWAAERPSLRYEALQ